MKNLVITLRNAQIFYSQFGFTETLRKIKTKFAGTKNLVAFSEDTLNIDQILHSQEEFAYKRTSFQFIERKNSPKKNFLVFLQSGAGLIDRERFRELKDHNFDLIVNNYDYTNTDFFTNLADQIKYDQTPGATKFLGYYLIATKYPDALKTYDYICFLDDDVEIDLTQIDFLFSKGRELRLDLFQASLSNDSHAAWPILKNSSQKNLNRDFEYFNTVEVMAPFISKRLIDKTLPYFKRSISTWGIDFVLGHFCINTFKSFPAVIYSTHMKHGKEINLKEGGFYKMLKKENIDPLDELNMLTALVGFEDQKIEMLSNDKIKVDHNLNLKIV